MTDQFLPNSETLEYDMRFIEIEAFWESRDNPDEPSSSNPPVDDFKKIAMDVAGLLAKSADLRLACWLLRAELQANGLSSLFVGIARIKDLLGTYGPHLHPLTEGERSGSAYAQALAWLSTRQCIKSVSGAFLQAGNTFDLQQLFELQSVAVTQARSSFPESFIFDKNFGSGNTLPDAMTACMADLHFIQLHVNAKTDNYFLDVSSIITLLKNSVDLLIELRPPSENITKQTDKSEVNTQTHITGRKKIRINSRDEVTQHLDHITEYFQINEPSHPALYLIKQIKKTVGVDFEKIVMELIPETSLVLSKFMGK